MSDWLQIVLDIHRESIDSAMLAIVYDSDRTRPQRKRLQCMRSRLELALLLLHEEGGLDGQAARESTRSIDRLLKDSLHRITTALDERDATEIPNLHALMEYKQMTARDPFNPDKVWRVINAKKLTIADPVRFSSHIEAAVLFGKRIATHPASHSHLGVSPEFDLLFTVIDESISHVIWEDTCGWEERGELLDAGYSQDPHAAEEAAVRTFPDRVEYDLEEQSRDCEQEAAETDRFWTEIFPQMPEEEQEAYFQSLGEPMTEEEMDQHGREYEQKMAKRTAIFGQLTTVSHENAYRFLGVFRWDGCDREGPYPSDHYTRVADEIHFDGPELFTTNEDDYLASPRFGKEVALRRTPLRPQP